MPRFVALYTGGKDSHTAVIIASQELKMEPALLLTLATPRDDSYLLHATNIRWAYLHSQLSGIPMRIVEISGRDEEAETLEALRAAVEETGARAVVTGGIASNYQKRRFDRMAGEIGVEHVAPLWGMDQEEILKLEVVEKRVGFAIVVTAAMGLGEEWVGRVVETEKDVEDLLRLSRKYSFSPVGEGGEYESYVVSSPLFKGLRILLRGRRSWSPSWRGSYQIEEALAVRSSLEDASRLSGLF